MEDGGDIFEGFSVKVPAEDGKKIWAWGKFLFCRKGDPGGRSGNQ